LAARYIPDLQRRLDRGHYQAFFVWQERDGRKIIFHFDSLPFATRSVEHKHSSMAESSAQSFFATHQEVDVPI
jgi:hypothetical protein